MKLIKTTLLLTFCFIWVSNYAQYTDVINSNRPGVSTSAFSVGTKVAQFEVGPYIINEERTPAVANEVDGFGVDFGIRYGLLWEQLELNVEGTYQNDNKIFSGNLSTKEKRSNFRSLAIGAKYLLYDPYKDAEKDKPNLYSWNANHRFKWKSLIPAVAIYAGANFDTPDNPFTATGVEGFSPKVMIATQNNFAGGWVFVMNLIKDRIGTNQSDFTYILTLTHSFNPKWVIFGETQGIKSDFYADNLFRFGGAYLWSKDFQLDTAITFNTKDTPSVFSANFGMSYRLDFHRDKLTKGQGIDNGNSAKDEGKRRANKNRKKAKKKNTDKVNDGIENNKKKRKKDDIDF